MMGRARLTQATVVAALLALGRSQAHACSCAPPPPPEAALAAATAVFQGTVTRIEPSATAAVFGPLLQVELDVARVWKGPVDRRQVVLTSSSDASCGIAFAAGGSYLIYALDNKPGLLATLCSRTRASEEAAADLAALGPGRPPGASGDAGVSGTTPDTDGAAGGPAVPPATSPIGGGAPPATPPAGTGGRGCAAGGAGAPGAPALAALVLALAWLQRRPRRRRSDARARSSARDPHDLPSVPGRDRATLR